MTVAEFNSASVICHLFGTLANILVLSQRYKDRKSSN